MKVVVLDGYTVNPGDNPWPTIEGISDVVHFDRTSREELVGRASSADVLVTNKTPLDGVLLDQLPNLKLIAVMATGYNIVDIETARLRGILVANVPAYGTNAVAQYTLALILELCHHCGEHARSVRQGEWSASSDWSYWKAPQIELNGLVLGIVGFGKIGQAMARLGHALGMRILYSSRSNLSIVNLPFELVELKWLFQQSDIVSLHCSLDDGNRKFVNKSLLREMKPTAFLVNTARGLLIDEHDLAQGLRDGLLSGAALDVLSTEPPRSDNPLIGAPRCIITPHIAWASLTARRRIVEVTVKNISTFLNGKAVNVVN